MLTASADFRRAMTSPIITLQLKLELYHSDGRYIREITDDVTADAGNISVDSSRPIRRNFSLRLKNKNGKFTFSDKYEHELWIDKRIKLFVGLKTSKGDIEYLPQGVFLLITPESSHTLDGNFTTISAVDKAYLMTDKRGRFYRDHIIPAGTKITDAIRNIASGVGETMFFFDEVTDTVPFELAYKGNTSRWDAITQLSSLAQCNIFYDEHGYLRLKKINLNAFDVQPAVWEYKLGDRGYAGNIRKFDDNELCNHVHVLGGGSSSPTIAYDLAIDEEDPVYGHLWKDNPYSIQKIGRITHFHNDYQPDPFVTNVETAKFKAKQELQNRLGFDEKITLNIFPNFLLDVDDIIWLEDQENGLEGGKYLITSFNIPLTSSTMQIECRRYKKAVVNWDLI